MSWELSNLALDQTTHHMAQVIGRDGRLYDESRIELLIDTNPVFLTRALVKIYDRQTRDEKDTKNTRHFNGVGFNAAHASKMSYYARWVLSGRSLSGTHLEKCKQTLKKYRKQILEEIAIASPVHK